MPFNTDCLQACSANANAATAQQADDAELQACFDACYVDASAFFLPLGASIILAAVLVLISGLFSGLNLGLLGLDLTGLKVVESAGTDDERKYARRLIRICRRGNLLLCTLLLGNTVINSAISIILSSVTNGAVGLVVSTFVILLLGEIIPQAICSRHALLIGYHSAWVVKFFMFLFLPITWPISKALDWWLGKDIGTVYSQEQLKRLIAIHVEDPEAQAESGLTPSDKRLLHGVLDYKGKRVCDVMTPLASCFMLELHTRLDFDTLSQTYLSGCSRVPVYSGSRTNIVGLLFVKDLILVDAADGLEVSTIMTFRGRPVQRVFEDVTLDKVLQAFLGASSQHAHMMIAHAASCSSNGDAAAAAHEEGSISPDGSGLRRTLATGLITLEDVLEEMIATEIYDEADADLKAAAVAAAGDGAQQSAHRLGSTYSGQYGAGHRRKSGGTHATHLLDGRRPDLNTYMSLFERKRRGGRLSEQEVAAVSSFLVNSIPEFRHVSIRDPGLQGLLRSAEVLEAGPTAGAHAAGGGASDGLQADASAAPCSLSPTAQTQPNQRLSQPQSNQADAAAPGRDEQQAERRASSTFKAQEAFSSLGQAVSDPASPSAVPEVGPGECSHADEQAARVQLYQQGMPSECFCLVLQGKVLVKAGSEGFCVELGPWSHLAQRALVQQDYMADFDAHAVGAYRIMRISRSAFAAAVGDAAWRIRSGAATGLRELLNDAGSNWQLPAAHRAPAAVPAGQATVHGWEEEWLVAGGAGARGSEGARQPPRQAGGHPSSNEEGECRPLMSSGQLPSA